MNFAMNKAVSYTKQDEVWTGTCLVSYKKQDEEAEEATLEVAGEELGTVVQELETKFQDYMGSVGWIEQILELPESALIQ